MGFGNANTFKFGSRNKIKWAIKFLLKFQYSLNLLHLWRMCHLDSIGYCLQGQLNSSLGKNLSLYLPIRAWLVITLETLAYNVLEWPKCLSHVPSLLYAGFKILLSLLTRSRKCLPFISDTWKVIFHLLMRLSHSFSCYSPKRVYQRVMEWDWAILFQHWQFCGDVSCIN